MAPPIKHKLDARQVKTLAGMGLTTHEIAAYFECSPDTLERRYAASLKGGRERLCASLKRTQYAAAMTGNPTMLIWLGKQYLGQRDTFDDRGDDVDVRLAKAEALLAEMKGTT